MTNDNPTGRNEQNIYDENGHITRCFCGSTRFTVFCETGADAKLQPDGTLIHGDFYELDFDEYVKCQECSEEFKLRHFRDIASKNVTVQ